MDTGELAPGNIAEVRAAGKIPADGRVISALPPQRGADQSAPTGESETANTDTHVVHATRIQATRNMAFPFTAVKLGEGWLTVAATGMNAETGRTHASLVEAEDAEAKAPTQEKLGHFVILSAKATFVICALVWVTN